MTMDRRAFIAQGTLAAVGTLGAGRLLASAAGPSRRPLRVVQVGTAHAHAPEKWTTLGRFPEVFEVVGLCEPDAGARRKAEEREEFRGARWIGLEEALSGPDIDAILVETELPDLLRQGRAALESGRHLHLDKPPGRDLAAFAALQDLARRRERVLQLGYMYRYHPAIRFCFDAQRRGWLGEIFAIHGEIGKVVGPARRPWLAENYGGSMMLLGCHLLDLTVGLLGAPERATAQRRRSHPEKDAFFDHEVALLEYPKCLATIRSLLSEVEGDDRRQFVVCGENATIEVLPLEPARVRVAFQRPPAGYRAGYQDVPLPPVTGRYDDLLLDFAGQVRGEPPRLPEFDAAHDRRAHEILLRVGLPS